MNSKEQNRLEIFKAAAYAIIDCETYGGETNSYRAQARLALYNMEYETRSAALKWFNSEFGKTWNY